MKKIKYLLGFGILCVLFGSCFGMTVIRESNSLDYGNHNSYNYYNKVSFTKWGTYGGDYSNPGFCSYTNFNNFTLDCDGLLNSQTFLDSSGFSFSGFNSSFTCNYNGNSISPGNSHFSIDSSHNIKYVVSDWVDSCNGDGGSYNGELLFSNNGEFNGNGTDYYLSYIHLIGENYNKNPGFIQSNGKMDYYYFFGANNVYSKYGSYNDVPNGYIRKKFYDGFDFNSSSIIVSESNLSDFRFISSNPYSFSSISTSNGTQYNFGTTTYSGYLVLSLGNYVDNFSVSNSLVLMLSGNNIYYNYFNIYSPYIETLSNSVVQSAGVLTTSNGSAFDLFSQFVNDDGSYFEVVGSFVSSEITFRSYKSGNNLTYTDYTFGLSIDSNSPVIIPPMNQGGNQFSGSIAINSGLLNSCLNDLTFGELNSYLCNQILSNLGYPVLIPGTSGQYISVSIDENGNLTYRITTQDDLAEQMSGFIWVENEDGTRSTVCSSGDCLGTILAHPIIHTGSFELTTGDVFDMITNLTGWVGRCPFPYTDFRLGKNLKLLQLLQDYGFKYDPFIIINCSVAGFHYGRYTVDTTLFGDTFEHPLLFGDTPKHRTLFVFLDFIVILGLLGLFAFIRKIF